MIISTHNYKKQCIPEETVLSVLTAQSINRCLDYIAPKSGILEGSFVRVPLGKKIVVGVVWGQATSKIDPKKLRKIESVIDFPPLKGEFKSFIIKASEYTINSQNLLLKSVIGSKNLEKKRNPAVRYKANKNITTVFSPVRERVLKTLQRTSKISGLSLKDLCKNANASPSVVKALLDLGAISTLEKDDDVTYSLIKPIFSDSLSGDQFKVATKLRQKFRKGEYNTNLLWGVTGSGKTEVYFEVIAEALKSGRQILVLSPEIALSTVSLERFRNRFKTTGAEWHSSIKPSERRRVFHAVAENSLQLVFGTRSAVFLPFHDLGLVIVDEEHDSSFKQEEGMRYHARDMAILRASFSKSMVILASATPSLETWVNVTLGKYSRFDLPKRYGLASLPKISTIDMRKQSMPKNRWISPNLVSEIKKRIVKGEQSLLFLNRRGYAPVTMCKSCGIQLACLNCDARLTDHKSYKKLICHQCGENYELKKSCPSCNVSGSFISLGPGVERIQEECSNIFEGSKIALLSSDKMDVSVTIQKTLQQIIEGDVDIIIGTQIISKGYNFPKLTLVGIIDSDFSLKGGDLRASEKTFQLLRQVAGRAGRIETIGEAYLQTYSPDDPVIKAILSNDDEEFWRLEANNRLEANAPPYGRMISFILSGFQLNELYRFGKEVVLQLRDLENLGVKIYGPSMAPVSKIRGRNRLRILVKSSKAIPIQELIRKKVSLISTPRGVQMVIDVDPQSFY